VGLLVGTGGPPPPPPITLIVSPRHTGSKQEVTSLPPSGRAPSRAGAARALRRTQRSDSSGTARPRPWP
jgi:hypothetical protein